jgi:hypothetical protein
MGFGAKMEPKNKAVEWRIGYLMNHNGWMNEFWT